MVDLVWVRYVFHLLLGPNGVVCYGDAGFSGAGFGGLDWKYVVVGVVDCGGAEVFENDYSTKLKIIPQRIYL
jgi:hypothetical protein